MLFFNMKIVGLLSSTARLRQLTRTTIPASGAVFVPSGFSLLLGINLKMLNFNWSTAE
jgi:hypothetical protein